MYSVWMQRKRIKLSSAFTSLHQQLIHAFQLFLKYVVDASFFFLFELRVSVTEKSVDVCKLLPGRLYEVEHLPYLESNEHKHFQKYD